MNEYADDIEPPVLPYEQYLPVSSIAERLVDRILNRAEKETEQSDDTKKSSEPEEASDDLDLELFSLTGDLLLEELPESVPSKQDNEDVNEYESAETEEEQTRLPCHPADKYAHGVCTCPVCYKRKQDALNLAQEEVRKIAEEAARVASQAEEARRKLEDRDFEELEERESLVSLECDEAWPDNGSFDKDSIIEMIVKISSSWNRHQGWMFCVNFLDHKLDCASDDYIYEVIWSVPTKVHPVPQATASVYFTAHISRISPPTMPIELTYTFENSCYVHKPDKRIVNFQERQLINIIQSKINIFRRIRF